MKKTFTCIILLLLVACRVSFAQQGQGQGQVQVSNAFAVVDTALISALDQYQTTDTVHGTTFKTVGSNSRIRLFFNAIPNRYIIGVYDYDASRNYIRNDEFILVRDEKSWKTTTTKERAVFDDAIAEFLKRMRESHPD